MSNLSRQDAMRQLLDGIGCRAVEQTLGEPAGGGELAAEPEAAQRQGVGVAVAPELLPRAPPLHGAAERAAQLIERGVGHPKISVSAERTMTGK